MLMGAERTKDGVMNSKDKEMIAKMEEELTKVIEDFMRAVDIEALCLTKKSGERPWSQSGESPFSVVLYRTRPFA